MNFFKINIDSSVYVISIFVILLFLAIFGYLIYTKIPINNQILTFIILICPLIITIFFVPTSYLLTEDKIVINKVCGSIKIKKADIIDIDTPKGDELKGSIRVFASGGFLGYFGKYKSPKLGKYNMYAGSMKANNLLVIKTKDGKQYVISPKNKEVFLFFTQQMLISKK